MRIIDLTLDISEEMPIPASAQIPPPKFDFVLTPDTHWSGTYTGAFSMTIHMGTHLDAPMHFNYGPGVKTIDKVPLDVLVGPAVIIGLPEVKAGQPVTAALLQENLPDVSTHNKRLIIWTGYTDERYGTPNYFQEAPYLTPDAADWIIEKGFVLVGLDFQTDQPGNKAQPVHNKLLPRDIYILEYICNCHQLPEKEVFLAVAPLKLKGMEASPVRVFAIEGIL